jgi:hypothetical protein
MEVHLGRKLAEDATVDHIDKNPLNNSIDNLQVLSRSNHASLDCKRRRPVIVQCSMCGKKFEATRSQLHKDKTGFFCSKQCSGKYGAEVQNGRMKKVKKEFTIEYYCNKDILQ